MHCDPHKVTIVGCGKVGMTGAYSLLHAGTVDELVLFGRNEAMLHGEELDLEHGISFLHNTRVTSTVDYADTAGSDVVVITAGAAQKPGETRLDLATKNIAIIESIVPAILSQSPEAVIVLVSNPVDVLTYKAHLQSHLPVGRIFGTGTTLDTARFRFHLSEMLKVNPRSIHAYILGEHGDHSFPSLLSAYVGGQQLMSLEGMSRERLLEVHETVKQSAYRIIEAKGATYYAIGSVISHVVSAILTDAQSILPVSVPIYDYYGHTDVAISMPCVIGSRGVEKVLQPELSDQEQEQLWQCVQTLQSYL